MWAMGAMIDIIVYFGINIHMTQFRMEDCCAEGIFQMFQVEGEIILKDSYKPKFPQDEKSDKKN